MRAGRLLTLGIACLLALWCARQSFGHIRLSNPGNGSELYWPSANSIGIVVQGSGSDDIDDGTDLAV